jgi:hypothetical protein
MQHQLLDEQSRVDQLTMSNAALRLQVQVCDHRLTQSQDSDDVITHTRGSLVMTTVGENRMSRLKSNMNSHLVLSPPPDERIEDMMTHMHNKYETSSEGSHGLSPRLALNLFGETAKKANQSDPITIVDLGDPQISKNTEVKRSGSEGEVDSSSTLSNHSINGEDEDTELHQSDWKSVSSDTVRASIESSRSVTIDHQRSHRRLSVLDTSDLDLLQQSFEEYMRGLNDMPEKEKEECTGQVEKGLQSTEGRKEARIGRGRKRSNSSIISKVRSGNYHSLDATLDKQLNV